MGRLPGASRGTPIRVRGSRIQAIADIEGTFCTTLFSGARYTRAEPEKWQPLIDR